MHMVITFCLSWRLFPLLPVTMQRASNVNIEPVPSQNWLSSVREMHLERGALRNKTNSLHNICGGRQANISSSRRPHYRRIYGLYTNGRYWGQFPEVHRYNEVWNDFSTLLPLKPFLLSSLLVARQIPWRQIGWGTDHKSDITSTPHLAVSRRSLGPQGVWCSLLLSGMSKSPSAAATSSSHPLIPSTMIKWGSTEQKPSYPDWDQQDRKSFGGAAHHFRSGARPAGLC